MKRLIFIVNPAAKNGVSKRIWDDLVQSYLTIPYEVFYTKHQNHAKELAKSIAESNLEPLLLVAVGGDGTIHEVINGIISFEHITIAYIPAGSGNDFARGFQLPLNPEKCLALILKLMDEDDQSYDAGLFDLKEKQGYFVNSLGVGFDAVISHKANQSIIKKWLNKISLGNIVYAIYLFIELFRYKPGNVNIIIDGKHYHFEKTWFITVSNQPFYGGGMIIAPHANPSDGKLEITVVHQILRMKLLLVFLSVFWGKHTHFKEVMTYTGKTIMIDSEKPIPVHTDGEHTGATPVRINIQTKCWRMINTATINNKRKFEELEIAN